MADNFKAIHTYSDPGLDKQEFYKYDLSVRLHSDGFSYCIFDSNANKCLHLQAFDLSDPGKKIYIPGEPGKTDTAKLVQLLGHELKWLCEPFNKVRILIEQGKSTLVPDALFSEEEKSSIFDFNVAGGPYQLADLKHDHLKSTNAYAIYHIPAPITVLAEKYFPGALIYHHSSAIIQSLYLKYRNEDNNNVLFVNTAASHIDILQIKNKKLDYYNSFLYNTAEDFMYYLVFVVEQLNLNPENVELVMMGEIERHSPLSDLIHKYIRHVRFIERNSDFRYSFVFDQLPGHYYYNLLNAALCE